MVKPDANVTCLSELDAATSDQATISNLLLKQTGRSESDVHPLGLFRFSRYSPRVITNSMMSEPVSCLTISTTGTFQY